MPDLDFAPVIWRLGLWAGDQLVGDADDYPDTIWFDGGTVLLTPYTGVGKVIGATPTPYTGVSSTYEAEIDSEGYLTYHGKRVMWVTDLTSDKVNPPIAVGKATHRVAVTGATAGGQAITLDPFDVRITKDGDGVSVVTVDGEPVPANDITRLAPVIPGAPQPVYRGERGVSIASLAVTDLGVLEVELDDGTTLEAGELPVGPGGSDAGVAGYMASPASETATETAAAVADTDHPVGEAVDTVAAARATAAQAAAVTAAATDATTKASAAQAAAATDATTKANAARTNAVADVAASIPDTGTAVGAALSASTADALKVGAAPAGDSHSVWYQANQPGANSDERLAAAMAKWAAAQRGGKIVFEEGCVLTQPIVIPNDITGDPATSGNYGKQYALVFEGQGTSHAAFGTILGGTVVDHTYNAPTAVAKVDTRGTGKVTFRNFTWRDTSAIVRTVTNKALTGNVATLTVGTHTVKVGQSVVVAGVDATFNGTVTVTAVTGTTISYAKTADDVASAAATGTVTGGDHTPFFQTTNTTPEFDGVTFWGEKQKRDATQDAIYFGGGGPKAFNGTATGQFAGYRAIVRNCTFHRIRRAVWMRAGCNGALVEANTIWTTCGSPDRTIGAVQLTGDVIGSMVGNVVRDNMFEVPDYPVAIVCDDYVKVNSFINNDFYDATSGYTEAGISFAPTANGNFVQKGYYDVANMEYYTEAVGAVDSNMVVGSTTGRSTKYAVPALFKAGVATVRSGAGVAVIATNGDRGYMRVSGGSAASPSYPEAIITTAPGVLVTDLVTTSGSRTVTSATAAFVANQKGMPISAAGFPANTTISRVVNATTVELSALATATATGVTAQIGRAPETTGTATDEIGFARRHIVTKGSITTAAASTAAGGSGSGRAAVVTGTDTAFKLTVTTGSSGTTTGTLATVTYAVAFTGSAAVPVITPGNAAAAKAMKDNEISVSTSNTVFTLTANAGTPPVSTDLVFFVHVIQS